MSSDPFAISLTGVGKRYTKYVDQPMLATAALRLRSRSRREKTWAVRDVNLNIAAGERVGVIGRNGSGKSTMLRMLAGVTAPTEGRVIVRGRVAPLVHAGVGFHPELTGRENVYINGTILGLTREQIDERLEKILAFSEIGDYINTPVKFYSSGMYVRLGFSVAAFAEPEVLLVDEVLAVGDMQFQNKCFARMIEIAEKGTTIVIVSHNLHAIRMLCPRTVLLHQGEMKADGPTADSIALYHEILHTSATEEEGPLGEERVPFEPGVAEVETIEVLDGEGMPKHFVNAGDHITLRVVTRFDRAVADPVIQWRIDREGSMVYADSNVQRPMGAIEAGRRVTCEIRMRARFTTGSHVAKVRVYGPMWTKLYSISTPADFYVAGRSMVHGAADLMADFEVESASAESSAAPV